MYKVACTSLKGIHIGGLNLRRYGQRRKLRGGSRVHGPLLSVRVGVSSGERGSLCYQRWIINKRAFHTSRDVGIGNNPNKSGVNNQQKSFPVDGSASSSPKVANSKDRDAVKDEKLPSQPVPDSFESQEQSGAQEKPVVGEGELSEAKGTPESAKMDSVEGAAAESAMEQSGEEYVDPVPAVPDVLGYVPTPFKKYRRSKYWSRERITNFKSFLSSAGRYFVDEEVDILRTKTREFIQWSIFPPEPLSAGGERRASSEGGGGVRGGSACVQKALGFLRDVWLEKVLELNAHASLTSLPSEGQTRSANQSRIGFSLQTPPNQEAFVIQMVRELASKYQANFVDFDFLFLRTTMNWFIENQSARVVSKEIQVSLEQFLQDLQRNDDDFILFLDDLFHLVEEATAKWSKEVGARGEGVPPLKYVVMFRNLGMLRTFPHHMIRERLKAVKVPMLFVDLMLETSPDRAMIVPISIVTQSPPSSSGGAEEDEYGVIPSGASISSDLLHRELFSKFKSLLSGKGTIDTLKGYRALFGDEAIDVTKRPLSSEGASVNSHASGGGSVAGAAQFGGHHAQAPHIRSFLIGATGREEAKAKEAACEAVTKAHEVLMHDMTVRQNVRNLQACFHAHNIELLESGAERGAGGALGRSITESWLESEIESTTTGKLLVHVSRLLKKDEVSRIVSLTIKYHDLSGQRASRGASGDAAGESSSGAEGGEEGAVPARPSGLLASEQAAPAVQSAVQSAVQANPMQEVVSNDFLRLLGEEQLNFMLRQSILIKYLHLALELEIGVTHYVQSPGLSVNEEKFAEAIDRAYRERMAAQQREFDMVRESHHYDMLKARIQHSNLSNNERRIFDTYVQPSRIGTTFDDIASLDHAKEELLSFIVPIKMPVFQSNKLIKNPLGILLYGPPGTGKTMLARAVARSANANFIHISASTIVSKWLGESESNAAAVFSLAKKLSPCIIFIDEVDGLLNTRDASEHESSRRVKNEFFSGWDGLLSSSDDPNISVTVIAATNRPFDLDAAALRRLPHRVLIPLPDKSSRIGIFTKILRNVSIAHEPSKDRSSAGPSAPLASASEAERSVIINQLSSLTDGYSGSDIKSLCTRAALQLVRDFMSDQDYKALQKAENIEREGNYDSFSSDSLQKLTQLASAYASRPLTLTEFKKALFEIGKSVDHRSRTQLELKKWHEMYGSKSYHAKSKTNRTALGFQ
ncbi:uncharacterized protein LOC126320434 isoform X2 [Schistocerca gregaria]|uniref:uncharacterized protein LOC126320434 isoform X2 n=1 Tax=Schistocerca gregaria TaxID=7010 RepID=UPI00211E6B09|nr:uncharacterized protein LOC126320434 isoform X2 [Schistocerca gregaria]